MADYLSATQLATFRSRWIGDLIDDRVEWNATATTPTVATSASAGVTTLAIDGLGAGTIHAGTVFTISHNGKAQDYIVAADATIAAGAASVTFAPALQAATAADVVIAVKPLRRSLYNRGTGETYFSDAALLLLAKEAMETRGPWIANQDDRDRALFQTMRVICIEQMLADSTFTEIVMSRDETAGARYLDRLKELLAEDRSVVDREAQGAGYVMLIR